MKIRERTSILPSISPVALTHEQRKKQAGHCLPVGIMFLPPPYLTLVLALSVQAELEKAQ